MRYHTANNFISVASSSTIVSLNNSQRHIVNVIGNVQQGRNIPMTNV